MVQGLLKYGYQDDAKRIAQKWLETNHKVFQETKTFWERYHVVKQKLPRNGRYPLQYGFGWSCAVFLKFVEEFVIRKEN